MPLDFQRVEKPFNKLARLLKKLPKQPSPEQVHDIRTRARRVEAALHAVALDRKRLGGRTADAIAPVRQRAGKVRDMDVLIEFASTLSPERDRECHVQLLEHLGHKRFQYARKLHKTVGRRRSAAGKFLRRCASLIERNLSAKERRRQWAADSAAAALELSTEIANWPKLSANNLHPFRLKLKELIYVLQLSGQKNDVVKALREVKKAIGEWHDWTELASIAENTLQHSGACNVQKQIRVGVRQRLQKALASANRLRDRHFTATRIPRKNARAEQFLPMKEPVLKATAALAA